MGTFAFFPTIADAVHLNELDTAGIVSDLLVPPVA